MFHTHTHTHTLTYMHAQTWRTRSVPRRADPCCTCAMQSASELQKNYTTHRDTVAHLSHEKRAGWPPVSTLRPTYCSHLLPLARCLPFSHNVAFPFAFISHSLFFVFSSFCVPFYSSLLPSLSSQLAAQSFYLLRGTWHHPSY